MGQARLPWTRTTARSGTEGTETAIARRGCAVWNLGRTPAEMVADMYTELTGTEPGLQFYANFEDGPGPTTADLGAVAFTCTLGSTIGPDAADPTWSGDVPF